jgi:hypothetical protein
MSDETKEKHKWSVRDILDKYSCLGLPHFQRGHVWNSDAVGLLLESLYFDTPCGSIVLWRPKDPSSEGVPLPGGKTKDLEFLLVDGQQRVRSIHDAFKGILSDAPNEEDDSFVKQQKDRPRTWCLNLSRIPELEHLWHDSPLIERPLFMHLVDPRLKSTSERYRYDLLPLDLFLDESKQEELDGWELISAGREQVLDDLRSIRLTEKIKGMFDRTLFVVTKTETDQENSLADMVELYNRINSGGMRVQEEEKAFATLLTLYPGTKEWLQNLFQSVHGKAPATNDGNLPRDELLRRTQERRFGFRLFLRALVQAASYHFGYSIGSSSLSFGVLQSPALQSKLRAQSDEKVKQLFDESSRIVIEAANLIRNELYCDAFQFLPDTTSLIPVFQLLLTYPGLLQNRLHGKVQEKLAALLILKLMAGEESQRDMINLAKIIANSNSLGECAEAILAFPAPENGLEKRLEDANSLQDRYVLLLYWLNRRRNARDFLYAQVPQDVSKGHLVPGTEVEITAACSPEKQHIVPYSRLKDIFNISGRGRTSSHPANNIGNLTYISQRLNSFEYGLGDTPLDLDLELKDAPDNAHAHLLSKEVGEYYKQLLEKSPTSSDATKLHGKFCISRRKLIALAFRNWLDELRDAATFEESHEVRMEPHPRLFAQTLESMVREFDYDNRIEDRLIRLGQQRLVKSLYRIVDHESRELRGLGIDTLDSKSRFRTINLLFEDNQIVLEFVRENHSLASQLRAQYTDLFLEDKKVMFDAIGDDVTPLADVLDWMFDFLGNS